MLAKSLDARAAVTIAKMNHCLITQSTMADGGTPLPPHVTSLKPQTTTKDGSRQAEATLKHDVSHCFPQYHIPQCLASDSLQEENP